MSTRNKAFTLVELCITAALISIIAGLGYVVVSDAVSSAKKQKLATDVAKLNRSVIAFIGTGGDISGAKTPNEVLSALKKSISNAGTVANLSGSTLDNRVKFDFQTPVEARSGEYRAYWNSNTRRFEIATTGSTPGINNVHLDNSAPEEDPGERESDIAFRYASKDKWIWDFTEAAPEAPLGETVFPTTQASTSSTPPVVPSPPTTTGLLSLSPPTFSVPGGNYPFTDFGINLSLSNPNPAGSSSIYYSIDYGNWLPYTGSLDVTPETNVRAMAVTESPNYSSSAQVNQFYSATPLPLTKPIISPSGSQFGLFVDRLINVNITNPNDPTVSTLQYRLAGGPWQDYNDEFQLSRNDYLSGVLIQARAVPIDPVYYLESERALRTLGVESATVAGTASGSFHSPTGAETMVTGGSDDYFEWGRDFWSDAELNTFSNPSNAADLSKSWLNFEAQSFGSPVDGNRFEVGDLRYFNGSVVSLTGADQVSFTADLNFNIAGYTDSTSFNFDFALLNTENFEDPNDPWKDADFVRLLQPIAEETLFFNGIEFQLKLEFGETTDAGLATFDEFHVLEGKDATTKLYGTLVEVGEIDFND
ncbi:MAG: choice-of-anchor K domain-containing protein [Verrucomicrobiales bacterium]|nr:choice-of-anchor K domain-containing protein [Verrucomicrobiales bacterium]